MKQPLTLCFAAVLLLAGCAGQPAADTSSRSDEARAGRPGVPLAALIENDFATVLDRLNPPLRVEEEPIENRHVPGQVDTLRTYFYEGLRFTVYDVSASGKKLLQNLTVTSDAYPAPQGVRVGMTRQEITQRLGTPVRQEDGVYIYHLGDGPIPNPILSVHFENDTVSTLKWSFYVD